MQVPLTRYIVKISIFNTICVSSRMYPENTDGTQVIVDSMNMGYISDSEVLAFNIFFSMLYRVS